jgi:hypothetical protein
MSVNSVIVANFSLGVGVDRYHSNKHEFGNRGMTEEELAECGIEMVATLTTCRNVKKCQHSVFLMAVTVSSDISLNITAGICNGCSVFLLRRTLF